MREILFTGKRTDDGEGCHRKMKYRGVAQA